MSDHVSDLRWDRWLAGELSKADADAALAHARECERCGVRMRELTAGRDAFAVPLQVTPIRRRKPNYLRIGAAATVLAAAATVVLVTRPREPHDGVKGRGLELIVEANQVRLRSGDRIRPGDTLQAGYTSDRDGFGAVLARDGAGGVFAYAPSRSGVMVALPASELQAFPESTTLDDVVGTERVFVVWCVLQHPIAPLLAELRATGELATPVGCTVRRLELVKR